MRPTVLVLFALGCSSPSRPEPAAAPSPPPQPPRADVDVEIHEWGLIDVDATSGTVEISAGPGQPARPMIMRKPILYFHLLHGDAATLNVRARVPGGAILEHWPPGELAGDSIAWNVGLRRGPCEAEGSARRPPPRRWREASECGSPDGFCEVNELPRYVTTDHDCLDVGGTPASLLFYRASARADALPLEVSRGNDLALAVTAHTDAHDAPRTLLRISTAMAGRWPAGRIVVARAEMPARDRTVTMRVGEDVLDPQAERDAMGRALGEIGLTPPEANAFVAAWADELFGGGPQRDRQSTLRQDVLLYWLSPDDVARLSIVEAGPASVALRRAFLVRIALPAVPTD